MQPGKILSLKISPGRGHLQIKPEVSVCELFCMVELCKIIILILLLCIAVKLLIVDDVLLVLVM